MAAPIEIKTEQPEAEERTPELTVRDCRTGKLRTVPGVVWTVERPIRRPRLELWERDQRRGGLTRVISWQDQRDAPRWGERDPEELDVELLAAHWIGY